jgi:hypothetical protein
VHQKLQTNVRKLSNVLCVCVCVCVFFIVSLFLVCFVFVYCNPSLGLVTKARGCKVAGQERSSGVMLHAPRSAKECEGIDPRTPKRTPTLGVRVLMEF